MHQRLRFCFGGIFALISLLALRLFYLQILQNVNYSEIAEKQFKKKVRTESYRGEIRDRNGQILAKSVESYSIYLRPKEFKKNKSPFKSIPERMESKISELLLSGQSKKDFIWVDRKLASQSIQWAGDNKIKGIGIVPEQKRYYPNGPLAAQVIGSVGLDQDGLSGIEHSFNSFLKGKQFLVNQFRDGKGRNLESSEIQYSNAISLTIDRTLQFVAERELKKGVEEMNAARGMILMQNPKTGEILAMASTPGFNPNDIAEGKFSNLSDNLKLQNPAVSGIFEPGSTFKIVTFAAALEERKFSLSDTIFCEAGKWGYGTLTIHDHEPSNQLTFEEVMEKSSNIGSAKICLKMDRQTFYRYIRAFGFGTKTGIPFIGESEGLLRNTDQWSVVSQPILAFGQEIGVTAIQLIGSFSAIANRGILMEPLIVKQFSEFNNGKSTVTGFASQPIRRVVSEDTALKVSRMLVNTVEKGTGIKAKIPGYTVAGKTGTAQKIDFLTGKYSSKHYISSFCGFLPAEDPQVVCLIIIDEPKKDYWGSSVAAPIFSRVVSRAVKILGISPSKNSEITLAQK